MTWLKVSQSAIKDQILKQYGIMDSDFRRQEQEIQLSQKPTTYYEQVVMDHQRQQRRHEFNTQLLAWLQSQLPQVLQSNDPGFIAAFQKEIAGLQASTPPVAPQESEFDNFFDLDVFEFYAMQDKDVNEHIVPLLDANNIYYEWHTFPSGVKVMTVEIDGDMYVVTQDKDGISHSEANEWVRNNADNIFDFYPNGIETVSWDQVGNGYVLYHGTKEDRLPDIMEHGLEPRDETRGFTNRHTGAAVFASADMEESLIYGNVVLEIDMGQMKADGYMPDIEMEGPAQDEEAQSALAHAIGLDDFHIDSNMDGITSQTVLIRGVVPPKYLKRIQ